MELAYPQTNAVSVETRFEIADFLSHVARVLDEFDLDQFVDQFVEDGHYILIPRDNHNMKMPVAVIDDNRDRLIYRKELIRKHWHYDPHRATRIVSNPIVEVREDGSYHVISNFVMIFTTAEGASRLHMAGVFNDDLVRVDGRLKFKKRYAILDTFLPDEAVVTPP